MTSQSLAAAAEVNPFDGADDDPVAMAFDDFLDGAIDDRERVLEAPSAGGELAPSRTFVARRPVNPAAPGEPVRQILVARVEYVDAIVALALDDGPG
jgi:hypothetical protein